ncbi:hypothetical protein DWV16_00270 [Anaerotruncus sp. AF02-27]|uniref:hypothetical protein n=1 Tax=Anaerotruncus sp. AF02-27 TaxID=2292191 RepID=UPI000E4B51DE|nr:hypothetical protein [Anaerotruncus sp. AF02-27]RGX56795.1 hypothetical protein DWV16_00270 [Anaerotruncus sp. AF02-27]
MKTTFEKELRKLFDHDALFDDARFVGRSCYGRLDGDLRVQAQFISLSIQSQFDALKISLLNRKEGVVDTAVLRFDEVWGIKKTANPNFREGVHPHLWQDGNELCWYVYQPTPADFETLSGQVDGYLAVFRDQELSSGLRQSL